MSNDSADSDGVVVDINSRKRVPTITGPVVCLHCKHMWEAVSPPGVFTDLECPKCELHKGVRKGLITVPVGAIRWQCDCGCDAFILLEAYAVCIVCGTHQSWTPVKSTPPPVVPSPVSPDP